MAAKAINIVNMNNEFFIIIIMNSNSYQKRVLKGQKPIFNELTVRNKFEGLKWAISSLIKSSDHDD